MKTHITLMRREVWEHPMLWILPAIFGAILLTVVIVGLTLTGSWENSNTAKIIVSEHKNQTRKEFKHNIRESAQRLKELSKRIERNSAQVVSGAHLENEIIRELASKGVLGERVHVPDEVDAQGQVYTLDDLLRDKQEMESEAARIAQYSVVGAFVHGVDIGTDGRQDISLDLSLSTLVEQYRGLPAAERRKIITYASATVQSTFAVAVLFLVFFYALDSLYAERKDRSALYWKSLPVSDGQTVLSKLATAIVSAPLIAWIATIIMTVLLLIIASVIVSINGGGAWDLLWSPAQLATKIYKFALAFFMMAIWYLPAVGWLLLVSAWSKRTPFLVAILVPIVLLMLERWLFGTHWLSNTLYVWSDWFWHIESKLSNSGLNIQLGNKDILETVHWGMLAQVTPWIGMLLAAVFVTGATYARRYRDES